MFAQYSIKTESWSECSTTEIQTHSQTCGNKATLDEGKLYHLNVSGKTEITITNFKVKQEMQPLTQDRQGKMINHS